MASGGILVKALLGLLALEDSLMHTKLIPEARESEQTENGKPARSLHD